MRNGLILSLFCLTGLACGHTHGVSETPSPGGADTSTSAASPPGAAAVAKPAKRDSGDKADVKGTPLFVSPADELSPDGLAKLQARLVKDGALASGDATGHLDAKTERALREFQRGHHLPATGAPDDATVGALGLKPDDVFRRREK